jgi:peptide/nickel transport system permease protein
MEVVAVRRFLLRKVWFYLLTFVVAVSIDWAIPRFMPGDPIQGLISRMQAQPESEAALTGFYTKAFGLDVPLWKQYLNFWNGLLHGDLGISVWQFPTPVTTLIAHAVPYTLALMVPAVALSFIAGNKVGALAARRKVLDNTVLPVSYVLTATPYMWLAILLAYVFASVAGVFPLTGAYAFDLQPGWTPGFALSFAWHWFLPFLSLFLVGFGGWAIGMRNMIIYELESDYSQYLAALGAPRRLVRRYAYRNAILPQVTGLALALGTVVGGALVTEVVFTYPGIGSMTLTAIQNRDYFLLQGIFICIITGVLIANFIVDVAYVLIDPRTRLGVQGGDS